jgi:hypothetical protein
LNDQSKLKVLTIRECFKCIEYQYQSSDIYLILCIGLWTGLTCVKFIKIAKVDRLGLMVLN